MYKGGITAGSIGSPAEASDGCTDQSGESNEERRIGRLVVEVLARSFEGTALFWPTRS